MRRAAMLSFFLGLVPGTLAATAKVPPPLDAAPQRGQERRYGGRGSEPLPLAQTTVELRSAVVHITEVPVHDGWQVSADYDLYNPSAVAAGLSLLLPEQGCPKERACTAQAGSFQDLGTRLGEQVLAPRAADASVLRPFADPPGEGHVYAISLPPRTSVRLSQEYRFDRSAGAELFGVRFLSSAGRWGGSAQKVRYIIELKQPTPYVLHPRSFRLVEFAEKPAASGPGSRTRLVFVAESLVTRSDFVALFPEDRVAGQSAAGYCQGFRGDLNEHELAPFMERAGKDLLRACQDQIYALHGFPFKDPAQRARHYGAAPTLPAWAAAAGLAIAARPQNPRFQETLLAPGEQAYLRALRTAESRPPQ